jgi:tetratricopeptide (TPR) repeat protein
MTSLEAVVAAHLGANDMEGAKAVVRDALTRVPATELVAYFAGYQEMAFVLDQKERDLLYRLSPAAFDNDRAWWGQALSIAAYQQGDMVRARAYADSSLETSKSQVEANPSDPQLRALYAVMLAYAGQTDEAIRQADQAVADAPRANNNDSPYARVQRIRVLIAAGRTAEAIRATEEVMGFQYYYSPGYLEVDPMFDPIRNEPGFKRLLAGTIEKAVD